MQRQWQRKPFRLEMLTQVGAWPMQYTIGILKASDLTTTPNTIQEHVARWLRVSVGEVVWREVNNRASSEPIRMPSHWTLQRPSDWVRATADRQIRAEYELLEHLAGHGVDTKFFERNRHLLTRLLDARFAGEVSDQGLHGFLDATPGGEHWLLLVSLQRGILPFKSQQVRSQELSVLTRYSIQASRVLVVENRQCWHSLPVLDDTLAVLGSGLDLDWLSAEWLEGKHIAYWGDIDTLGLAMLARARQRRPRLVALLMDRDAFERHAADNAVAEPVGAGDEPPVGLNDEERELYHWLLNRKQGRLEQEYLPEALVHEVLQEWVDVCTGR